MYTLLLAVDKSGIPVGCTRWWEKELTQGQQPSPEFRRRHPSTQEGLKSNQGCFRGKTNIPLFRRFGEAIRWIAGRYPPDWTDGIRFLTKPIFRYYIAFNILSKLYPHYTLGFFLSVGRNWDENLFSIAKFWNPHSREIKMNIYENHPPTPHCDDIKGKMHQKLNWLDPMESSFGCEHITITNPETVA